MNNPLISIITVCYNSEKTIKDTIESVLNQTYKNFEYIIVDGKSTDNTLHIINQYDDKRIKLISEKDNGIYDAMNKGIKVAKGDIIATINSDDILENDLIFSTIVNNFKEDDEILYGNVRYYNYDFSKIIRDYISGPNNKKTWCPAHPSLYIKKRVFNKIGLYDLQYKISADYDFMIRCKINKIGFKYINQYFVKMRYGGKSNGIAGYFNNFVECIKVLKNNNVRFPISITILRTINTFLSYR